MEALARSGVGHLTVVDADVVDFTNLNRQVIALESTVGQPKVEVMAARIAQINPACEVDARQCFFRAENAADFPFAAFDYVVDCIDTLSAKLAVVCAAKEAGVPTATCTGAGNKLDPTRFRVADIEDTRVDRLARLMRKELRRRGVKGVKAVYSDEPSCRLETPDDEGTKEGTRPTPGSVAFIPSVAGLILAGEVVKDVTAAARGAAGGAALIGAVGTDKEQI